MKKNNLRWAAGLFLLGVSMSGLLTDAKRVRTSLKPKIEKTSKSAKEKASADSLSGKAKAWKKVSADKEVAINIKGDSVVIFHPASITFAGYDKQAGSNRETFHVVNSSGLTLCKAEIELIYKDMKGRMLHKRNATIFSRIPPGETRKTDIKSWDNQNSFYYYLSNPPRRVASPYQVEIRPLIYWLDI